MILSPFSLSAELAFHLTASEQNRLMYGLALSNLAAQDLFFFHMRSFMTSLITTDMVTQFKEMKLKK
jgi:hypothetical protein